MMLDRLPQRVVVAVLLAVVATTSLLYEAHNHADIHDAEHSSLDAKCSLCVHSSSIATLTERISAAAFFGSPRQPIYLSSVAFARNAPLPTDYKRGPPALTS